MMWSRMQMTSPRDFSHSNGSDYGLMETNKSRRINNPFQPSAGNLRVISAATYSIFDMQLYPIHSINIRLLTSLVKTQERR